MIGIYAAGLFVLLLYDATGCGNAFHRLLTMLDSRERFLDELKRSLATREMVVNVRERRMAELLEYERVVKEPSRARDIEANFSYAGLSAEKRFEHWTSPLTSVDPAFAFREALADERMALASGDFRRYVIPDADLIIKPGTKLKRLNPDEENQKEKGGQGSGDESQETHQAIGA